MQSFTTACYFFIKKLKKYKKIVDIFSRIIYNINIKEMRKTSKELKNV